MRLSIVWLIVGIAVLLAGCGDAKQAPMTEVARQSKGIGGAKDKKAPAGGQAPAAAAEVKQEKALAGEVKEDRRDGNAKKRNAPRKIIYTGQAELVVQDFDEALDALEVILRENGGYIAGKTVTGEPGQPRYGRWTLRIPEANFETFLTAIAKRGEMRQQTLESEDVTDRYFDTKAEVANLEAREDALRKLYKEKIAGSKLTDLLEVDRELNNVRGQINVRKGQLQRWDNLVEYATLTLTIRDRKDYVPPTSPDFGTTLGRTFQASLEALVWAGKGFVLVVVALAPWLAVLAVLALAVWLPIRFFTKTQYKPVRQAAAKPQPPPPPPGDAAHKHAVQADMLEEMPPEQT
jgi:hypothetical protein